MKNIFNTLKLNMLLRESIESDYNTALNSKDMMIESKEINIKRGKIIGSIIGTVVGIFICYYLSVNGYFDFF